MAVDHLGVILIQVFIIVYQITASHAQYVQYAGTSLPIPYVTSYPVQSYAPSTPVYQPVPSYQPTSVPYKAPTVGAASPLQHVPLPTNPVTPIYQPTAYQTSPHQQPIKATPVISHPEPKLQPIQPVPPPSLKETLPDKLLPKDLLPSSQFDSNILNNLAIALQLLIVSNLIHNPPPEPNPVPVVDDDIFPAIAPLPIAFIPPNIPEPSYPNHHIPNANFIGTTSFGDTGISKSMMNGYGAPTLPAPRSLGLMSPYDAIGTNSPYYEAFQPKPEPKSPYHFASDYKDLFSLSELFKI